MIRLAQTGDLESIVEIYNQAIEARFQTAYTEKFSVEARRPWLQQHLDPAYPVFVYLSNEKVVGWLSISPYREDRPALRYSVEVSYFIHSAHQKKGIGTSLLAHALPVCRQLGYKTIFAIIIDRNEASIRLMEKFGFEKWGYLPGIADYDGVECGQYYYGKKIV